MSERVLRWLFIRLRPAEGWLIFILFVIAWIMFIRAILEVGWVRDDQIVVWTGAVGLIISFLLAKRGRSPVWDWIIITAYTILTTILFLSKYSLRPLFDGGRIGHRGRSPVGGAVAARSAAGDGRPHGDHVVVRKRAYGASRRQVDQRIGKFEAVRLDALPKRGGKVF